LGAVCPTQGPESRTSIPGRLTDLSIPFGFTEKLRGQKTVISQSAADEESKLTLPRMAEFCHT
jgi:hypothetical protein